MMRHRDGLAPDLRALAPPGDSIAWRNGEATRPAGFGKIRIGIIGAMLLGLAWAWLSPGEAGTGALLATIALGGVALMLAISVVDGGHKTAVAVTTEHVLWRQCRPGSAIQSIPRSEIVAATVFDAAATVLLHGAAGREQRFTGIAAPRDMALSLGVRVEVWVDRGDPGHGGRLTRRAITFAVVMAGSLTNVFGYDIFLGKLPTLRALVVAVAAFAVAGLLYIGAHWLQARRMTGRQRRETACHLLDPIWRGRDPYTGGAIPWWEVPGVTLKLWLARHIYGGPHDCRAGLDPLVYEPGSLVPEPQRESA
jgi:hypothetical protein